MDKQPKQAVLLLADGREFYGNSFGYHGETTGEVCFNTGMSGYQEILTDPSYCKQIVTMTSPHIGNYGVNKDDIESKNIQAAGFIIKEESEIPSNWRSELSIGEYLDQQKIVGIKNIDTRALTRHIRDNGAMNGIISSIDHDIKSLKLKLDKIPSMNGLDLAKLVTTNESYEWSNNNGLYKVAAIDYGIKLNILRLLKEMIILQPGQIGEHMNLPLLSQLLDNPEEHLQVDMDKKVDLPLLVYSVSVVLGVQHYQLH